MTKAKQEPLPDAVVFAATLRETREKHGLTQERLARAADLTMNFVSDLERGVKTPGLTTLVKLAHALDCRPADLLAGITQRVVKATIKAEKERSGA